MYYLMDLPLKKSFELNNKIIGSISVFELLKRKENIIVPYTQRISDNNKVNEIVTYQRNHKERNNFYNYLGAINLHFCSENSKYYLVDGQHRFLSLSKLVEDFEDFDIVIEIVLIEKESELIENYNIINKNTPLPELSENINRITHKLIFTYFETKYEKIWTTSNRPKRPYMHKNHFQEAISYLIEKIKIDNPQKVIQLIEDHNQRISRWNPDRIGNMKNLKDPYKTINISKDIGCFLGLFCHSTEEYHYKWILDIIRNETGEEIKQVKKKKKAIPKVVKMGVWEKYVGNDKGCVDCLVCGKEKIKQSFFHAGHVISEFEGGKATINNLRPICNLCNSSMGTRNMGDFVEEHFPENLCKLGLA